MAWTIGLMSGTSLDGVDGVLAAAGDDGFGATVHRHHHQAFPPALRAALLALNVSGPDELHRAALAANDLTDVYAQVVQRLLADAGLAAGTVRVIGAHGQTVRHRPRQPDGQGYTLQLINGARLAEACGVGVVCDFRSRDVAAGGEGAPLVPAFHAARFGHPGRLRAVVNVGGMANLTVLHADGRVSGFDTGPGNVLMDAWCQQHTGRPYDADGAWGSGGQVLASLLESCLQEPYFSRPAPKSTGRDLFDLPWLQARLAGRGDVAVDVMATLTELTAQSIVTGLAAGIDRSVEGRPDRMVVCGGGAFNGLLMGRLQALLGADVAVLSSATLGVPPDQVEALAFAWLGSAFMARRPGNLPSVTGARGPRILGAWYPP
jgi:anhydro-N-acetylmuramic acid kinase